MEPILPEWLELHEIDAGQGAYGDLEPELRARLKSQIAFLHSYYGECKPELGRRTPWLDRDVYDDETPAPWALYLVDPGYSSGPGFLAALMPSILAGVREIIVCRVSDAESGPAGAEGRNTAALPLSVSAAMELAGLEQAYDLNATDAARLLRHLGANSAGGSGRLVLLGPSPSNPLDSFLSDIAWSATRMHVPTLSLPGRLKIAVDQFCPADYELLRWVHPQADIYSVERGGCLDLCDSLITDCPAAFQGAPRSTAQSCVQSGVEALGFSGGFPPPLCLQPGNEFLWVWHTMPPSFFRNHSLAVFNRPQR